MFLPSPFGPVSLFYPIFFFDQLHRCLLFIVTIMIIIISCVLSWQPIRLGVFFCDVMPPICIFSCAEIHSNQSLHYVMTSSVLERLSTFEIFRLWLVIERMTRPHGGNRAAIVVRHLQAIETPPLNVATDFKVV